MVGFHCNIVGYQPCPYVHRYYHKPVNKFSAYHIFLCHQIGKQGRSQYTKSRIDHRPGCGNQERMTEIRLFKNSLINRKRKAFGKQVNPLCRQRGIRQRINYLIIILLDAKDNEYRYNYINYNLQNTF